MDSRGIFGGGHTAERGKATNNKSGGGGQKEKTDNVSFKELENMFFLGNIL